MGLGSTRPHASPAFLKAARLTAFSRSAFDCSPIDRRVAVAECARDNFRRRSLGPENSLRRAYFDRTRGTAAAIPVRFSESLVLPKAVPLVASAAVQVPYNLAGSDGEFAD